MAWQDTLQDASFRGVPFKCQQIGRGNRRAIATHELPYRAGAELEDMNIGPREVRMRAYFYGDDYEIELDAFIGAVEAPGVGELVHPIHGAMTVMTATWEDEHEAEEVDAAVVQVTFIEDALREMVVFDDSSASAATDAIATGADDVRDAADDALGRFIDGLSFDMPRFTVLQDVFRQAQGFLGRVLRITGSVGLLLSDLDPIRYPRAYVADLRATVDRGFQGLPFGGRNEIYLGTYTSTGSSSAASGLADFQTLRTNMDPVTVVLVSGITAPSSATLSDVAIVQSHARAHAAAAIAEAAAIVLAGELDRPLLNRNDIEQITAQARTALQIAIDGARGALDAEGRGQLSAVLAQLAYTVQEAARAVINQRPPLIQRPAPVSGPLRLVAHAFYKQADRATELAALNALGRKVLVDKGDVLNAYSR